MRGEERQDRKMENICSYGGKETRAVDGAEGSSRAGGEVKSEG